MKNYRLIGILIAVLFVFIAVPATSSDVLAQKTKAKTLTKQYPVPKDWDYIYDKKKGYGFYVPTGSSMDSESYKGVDVTGLTTPTKVDIYVIAFKDKTLNKEDLLDFAVAFLEELGHEVTPGALQAESEDYAIADATTLHKDFGKSKLRILVGTDITDNYVMILGASVKNFDANEKIIDTIWGSFEMWSGGASGKN